MSGPEKTHTKERDTLSVYNHLRIINKKTNKTNFEEQVLKMIKHQCNSQA